MKFSKLPTTSHKNKTYAISFFLICAALLSSYAGFSYSKVVALFSNPIATISASNSEICKNETAIITFEGSEGTEPYTFTYEINDGTPIEITATSGSSVEISLEGTTVGDFTYRLTNVEDSSENSQEIIDQEITIKVNPLPTVDFTIENDNSCSGETIAFTNNSTGEGNLTYTWDFGDGTGSDEEDPEDKSFEALGCGTKTFDITLTVTDENGCSTSKTNTISVVEKPSFAIYDISEQDFSNCGNTSSSTPDFEISVGLDNNLSCIINYNVKWGDGTEEDTTSFPVSHNYLALGVYNMVITANSSNGCNTQVTTIVKNISNPSGSIVNPGSTQNICAPTNVIPFTISSWRENSLDTRYEIDYGDGNTLVMSQEFLINNPKPDPNNPENYLIPHIYTESSCPESYTASLSVINACGTTPSTLPDISVLAKLKLEFSFTENACINTPITFTNNSMYGNGSNCSVSGRFTWDFGDGTITSSSTSRDSQIHTYNNPGTYTVKLSATSFCGSEEIEQEICIEPEITSAFSVDTLEGCIPLIITTTNTTDEAGLCSTAAYQWSVTYSSDNCGSIANWEYTNGTDTTSENPQFLFNTPGKYTLNQKVTTGCGTTTVTKTIDVKKPATASIQAVTDACGTLTINPTATIENCSSNTASLIYNWTFIGGSVTSSNTLNPGNIEYTTPGVYEITLEVTNDCGVSDIATETFELFEVPNITNTNLTEEICDGQSTSEITLNSDNSETTYTWSATATAGVTGFITNGTSNNIPAHIITNTGNNPGTVTYTAVPSLNSCEGAPVKFIITINPTPTIDTQPLSSKICLDGTANLLEVSYTNGAGTENYQWFSNTNNVNSGGTLITGATNTSYAPPTNPVGEVFYYAEIFFSSGGCSKIVSNTASVVVVSQIIINPVADPQVLCIGGLSDELEVTFSNGTGTPSYQWYSNTTNSNTGGVAITGETNNTYTPNMFTAVGDFYYYAEISIDGNGCNSAISDVFQINIVTDPVIDIQPIVSQELCQNSAPKDLSIETSGGTVTTKTYQWYINSVDSSANGNSINAANSATYTPETTTVGTFYYYVVVSQPGAGCSVTSNTSQLIVNSAPTIDTQPLSSEICLDGTASLLEVSYTNGAGTETYQWFSNTTDAPTGGNAIPGATSNNYAAPTDVVGTIYYYVEISFSTGGCSEIVSNTASVIVNGVPIINDEKITVYSKTAFNFNPNSITSNTVPVGTKYTWSNPTFTPNGAILGSSAQIIPQNQISQTLENTETTPIEVTYKITPATTKCIGTPFTIVVTVNPSINSNASITNNNCFESKDGMISTNINGGIPFETGDPYLISWLGPNGFTSSDATIINLEAGLYILEIEDKEGYSIREELTVTQPTLLTISKDIEQNISCFKGSDGAIEVTVSGGTLPYKYNWTTTDGSGIIQSAQNQNGLTAGDYSLEITDKNSCIQTSNFILTEPEALKIVTTFKQDVFCFGEGTGAIEIEVSGGTPAEVSPENFDYLYSWTGPNGYVSSFKNINNVYSGDYTITITDNLNCVETKTIVITQSSEISINYTKTDVTCYGETDGAIDINITGGNPPYQISWSNLANGFSQSNLSADTYIATITDGNNCVKQASIEIIQPIFFITPINTPISCNNENDGSITLNLTGGVKPISVTWDDDSTAGVQRNNLAPGSYTVTILDSDINQCPITQTFIFTNPPIIAVSSQVTNALDCNIINSGSIDLTVSGGTKPYSYMWSTGEITEDLNDISSGDYSVEIIDKNDCVVTKQFSIYRQEPIEISLKTSTIPNCDLKTVSQKTIANVTGGFLPYTYEWSAGKVSTTDNSVMETSQNGSYTLTITDDKGCINSKIFLVDLPTIGNADYSYNSFSIDNYNLLSIEDPIQFSNLITGNYSNITWDFGDGSPTISDENPIHTYDQVGVFNVVLKIELDFGCIEFIEKTLNITKGYVLINPNAFSPNNDGYNETIRPSFRGFKEIEMTIFDTWGVAIYYEKNLELNGWNGKIKGLPAENGNYVMAVKGLTFYKKEINTLTALTLLK